MVTIRYYPSAYTLPTTWLLPARATLVEDNLCAASVIDTFLGDFYLYLTTWKDGGGSGNPINLPANAILDKLSLAFKWIVDNGPYFSFEALYGIMAYLDKNGNPTTLTTACGHAGTCAQSIFDPAEIVTETPPDLPTVATLNAQNFSCYVDWEVIQIPAPFATRARLDAAYIEVTYHLPVKAAGLMDGFIFVS